MDASMTHADHSEGTIARSIEQQTAKLPSDTFLWAAGAAIGTSLTLQMVGRQHASQFVGQWAPTFLILGLCAMAGLGLGSRTDSEVRRLWGALSVGAYALIVLVAFAYFYPVWTFERMSYAAWHARIWFPGWF